MWSTGEFDISFIRLLLNVFCSKKKVIENKVGSLGDVFIESVGYLRILRLPEKILLY